jgi:RNA polymerase sigma-70 factor (ECF subfamily)
MTDVARDTPDLIDRIIAGDESARHDLLERYRDYLRRMVAARLDRRLAPRIDPSDVVQETLADASRRMDEYLRDRPIPFFAWLRQLASDRVIDTHRRHLLSQKRSVTRESHPADLPDDSSLALAQKLVANDTSPSNRLMKQEWREQMLAAMAALSPKDREVLVMRHLEQLGTPEISEALGISTGAVEARLLRALVRLRRRLEVSP